MDYKKKYKDALEKAKSMIDDLRKGEDILAVSNLESMFPELKESEEERIRKEIIRVLKGEISFTSEKENEKFIAWLEKQGDKNKLIQELGEYKVKYIQEVLEKHLKTINKDDERLRKTTISFLKDFADKGYENAVECIDWLEKQGEQKSIDEAESEFKIGDWITFYGSKPFKILKVEPEQNSILDYLLLELNGHVTYYDKKYVDENARLWTIEDAKDGDMLADDRAILLFRNLGNKNWKNVISYYAILETNLNNRFSISDDEEYWGKVEDCELKPATKEQRDALEKAMADAGYTFDFDKKELKKIEDEEYNGKDYGIDRKCYP